MANTAGLLRGAYCGNQHEPRLPRRKTAGLELITDISPKVKVTNISADKELASGACAGDFPGSGSRARVVGIVDRTYPCTFIASTAKLALRHPDRCRSLLKILAAALPITIVLMTNNSWSQSRRQVVDSNTFPWSSIGKLNNSAGGQCTATVVGPNQFLTAAHCLYNIGARRFISPGSIHFLLGYEKGKYRLHRVAVKYYVPPNFDPTKINESNKELADDWAILDTSEPFPADIRPLRIAPVTPSPGTAVVAVGYAQERAYMLTADQHCRVELIATGGKMILHDCAIQHGDSGGPLLSGDASENGLIVGINVTKKRLRLGGESVSTANIAAHGSQAVGGTDGRNTKTGQDLESLPDRAPLKAAKLSRIISR
jgi:protease YdgD